MGLTPFFPVSACGDPPRYTSAIIEGVTLHQERIAVVGLGYVGLPVALAFARQLPTLGFDIDASRISELSDGYDRTHEVQGDVLRDSALKLSDDPAALSGHTFYVVTVPTPIDATQRPDLRALLSASRTVGAAMSPGAVVVYESTVYPGLTEEICVPALEAASGLVHGRDFHVGYSPERINPGDREHTLERITKVVSGDCPATLERVAAAYERVIEAGVHRASSIKVAEAAKVIENTQRDVNIALMNELSLIFERLGIPTADVLAAAGTKWNFLRFTPGLVGGHCIGVDPYYLTAKAESVGYHPQVILSGRRINDNMGRHVAQRVVKALARQGRLDGARIGVLGLTFKEDVPDLRNSRVPDILAELLDHGIDAIVCDAHARPDDAAHEYGVTLTPLERVEALDALILAVPHGVWMVEGAAGLLSKVRVDGVIFDVKSALDRSEVPDSLTYLAL